MDSTFCPLPHEVPDVVTVKSPCIVLAHPRTGSSLLMQTLAILGLPWIGRHHREDLGAEANPRGYFEDPDILAYGLTAEQVARAGSVDGCAIKIGLSNMMLPTRLGQWKALEAGGARILVPFRHPLESAVSLRCFKSKIEGSRELFLEMMTFLYNYTPEYVALANNLTRYAPGLKSRTVLIPYSLHIDDPKGFVERVRRHAGLAADPLRLAQATENIQETLYRVKLSEMPEDYRQWYEKTPAKRVYEILCNSPDPWEEIAAWGEAGVSPSAAKPNAPG